MVSVVDWLVIHDCVAACAALAFVMLGIGAVFASEFRRLSRRGAVVFIIGAVIATGVAQKPTTPCGDSLCLIPTSSLMSYGSVQTEGDPPPAYTNPVRFTSFHHGETALAASVAWDWTWSSGAYYHFLNFYGTYALPSGHWVDAGRVRITDWGAATNFSAVIQWPSVFSNAVASGVFPTNATLAAGFLSVFPELDTDGDGLYDGDEERIYGTRWDLCDSDGDGIDDADELFDSLSDPMNPDSDGDGMPDGWEWYCGLDPNDPSDALGDFDWDGLGNLEEALLGTRPDCSDTDGDLLSDYDEVRVYGTNPCLADTDGDGMDDREEVLRGFDPCFAGEYHGPERPDGYNSSAYYTVGITADEPLTWVAFEGDGESDLADPSFFIRSNETVDVTLLMGKTYRALATNSIAFIRANVEGVSVLTNAMGDLTIVRPVTVALLPEYNLMSFGAGSFGGDGSFRMGVYPDVGGVFDWTNSCCAVTSRGNRFWFACGAHCSCDGCIASGCLRYEGYALPCVGGSCGCPRVDDDLPTEADDQSHAAGVSLAFSERAVIFEDTYTNAPGVVVGRRSTTTTLSCTAHGGPRGARFSVSLAGEEKLMLVDGPALPSSVYFIPPGQKLLFEIEYEGVQPSVSSEDIVAVATLVEEETHSVFAASNRMTSVKLQLEAIYVAPENTNSSRHVYGVGEKVKFEVFPKLSGVNISTEKYDIGADSDDPYELFDGLTTVSGSVVHYYTCPISASYDPPIKIRYQGVEYKPTLEIVEPQEVITPIACWGHNSVTAENYEYRTCWPSGVVGSAGLYTTNYIGPMCVSFEGVAVSEVPCYEEDVVTGCFTNSPYRSHVPLAGAGWAHYIKERNYWCGDRANSSWYEPNWSPDSTMSWYIPIGWHRKPVNDNSILMRPDYERTLDPRSRALLIGNRIDVYRQIRHIDSVGTYRTDKFGHWISRSVDCEIVLDGVILQ